MAGHGGARRGMTGHGCRGMAWLGGAVMARRGLAWPGEAVEAGHGTECQGRARRDEAGLSGLGVARLGVACRLLLAWNGKAVLAWRGLARRDVAVTAWLGRARHVGAWRGCRGKAWRGLAGLSRLGMARPGVAGRGGLLLRSVVGRLDSQAHPRRLALQRHRQRDNRGPSRIANPPCAQIRQRPQR